MRLYKLKDNDIAPHFSLQEIARMDQSTQQFVSIYRSGEQIGRFDRQSGKFTWNEGVRFTEDCEYACLFEPEQGAYHNLILKDTSLPGPPYYQLNEGAGSTAEEKPEQGE